MNFFLLSLSFFLSLSWFLNVTHLVLQNINYGAEEGILETSSSHCIPVLVHQLLTFVHEIILIKGDKCL